MQLYYKTHSTKEKQNKSGLLSIEVQAWFHFFFATEEGKGTLEIFNCLNLTVYFKTVDIYNYNFMFDCVPFGHPVTENQVWTSYLSSRIVIEK